MEEIMVGNLVNRCSFNGIASRIVLWHRYTAKKDERRTTNNKLMAGFRISRLNFSQTIAWIILLICLSSNLLWAKQKLPKSCYLLELTSIGFPVAEKARDAWRISDLIFFDNKLYFGHGDAVVNTGPTDVIYYNIEDKKFTTKFTVDDEAIYYYQIIDNRLMIPGIDATEDWTFGNFYILTDTGWIKHRTIPNGLHVNYLASFGEKLFASTGTYGKIGEKIEHYFGGIFCSRDTGKTWVLSYATPSDDQNVYRVNALIVYKEKLFAFPYAYSGLKKEEIPAKYHDDLSEEPYSDGHYLIFSEDIFGECDVIVYDGMRWRYKNIIPEDKLCYVSKPFVFRDKLIMPMLLGEYIDYLSLKDKLPAQAKYKLFAFDGKNTRKIKLNYERLIDVLVKEEFLYLLIKRENLFYIAKTEDIKDWEYYLIPPAIKNPKSIEFNDGTFYVGVENGNIFESISSKPIKKFEEAKHFVPKNIFGAAELPRDGKWYWIAIAEWQNCGKLARISAEVKFGNVVKVNTENIVKMSIFLPYYHLDLNHETMLVIDNTVVYEGNIDNIEEFICTRAERNGENVWETAKGNRDFEEYKYIKKLVGSTEIELNREGEDPLVGCWKANVVRWAVGADLAVITRSGIRKDLSISNIYLEDIFDMNYRNTICTFEITGRELKRMMEFSLQLPQDKRCYVSGFNIKYKEEGSKNKIIECTLKPEKKYIVATEDYLAERAKKFFDKEIEYTKTDKDVYDAMIDWFGEFKVIKDVISKIEKLP